MKRTKDLTKTRFEKIRQFLMKCRQNPNTPARDILKDLKLGNMVFSSAVELGYIIPISKSKKNFKGYNFSYVYVTDNMINSIIHHERNKTHDTYERNKTHDKTPVHELKLFTEIKSPENISKVHFSPEDLSEVVNDLRNQGFIIPQFEIIYPSKSMTI